MFGRAMLLRFVSVRHCNYSRGDCFLQNSMTNWTRFICRKKTKVLIALFSVDWMSLTLEEQKLMQQKSHQDLMSYLSQSSRVGLGVKVRTRCWCTRRWTLRDATSDAKKKRDHHPPTRIPLSSSETRECWCRSGWKFSQINLKVEWASFGFFCGSSCDFWRATIDSRAL